MLHWRCLRRSGPWIPQWGTAFNTPWRCTSPFVLFVLLLFVFFQYSIGDAHAYWLVKADVPLELIASQYSIGDVAQTTTAPRWREDATTFNTPLEMPHPEVQASPCWHRHLSILHWRCTERVVLDRDALRMIIPFNTPLEMRKVFRLYVPSNVVLYDFQYSIGDARGALPRDAR